MMKRSIKFAILAVLIAGCASKKNTDGSMSSYNPPAPFKSAKSAKAITVKPDVRDDGIFFGDKGLVVHKSGKLSLMSEGRLIGDFYMYFRTPYSSWITTNFAGFQDEKVTRDSEKGMYSFSAKFPLEKRETKNMKFGNYSQTVKLLKNNKIAIDLEYAVPEGMERNIPDSCLFFQMSSAVGAGKKMLIDGKPYQFAEKIDKKRMIYSGRAKQLIFTPNNPATEFALDINSNSILWVRERGGNCLMRLIFGKKYVDKKISFILDISKVTQALLTKSKDNHAGIDFWKCDRLHVPDYKKSRNLVQNPSFEADLRYYNLHETWAKFKKRPKPVYETDQSVAKFGNASLKINCFKGDKSLGYLQTFAMPVIEGKKYTVSLYAKGSLPKGLRLNLMSVTGIWIEFPKLGSCNISSDWKRYNFTFTAPNRAVTILLKGEYYGSKPEATIWVDGLQLEQGDKVTEFTNKSLDAFLATSDPDNFLNMEQPVNAKLKIVTKPNVQGAVNCKVEDYFYETIWQDTFSFKTDDRGNAVIFLPLDGVLGKGIYVLQADFSLDDGYQDTDYFRISRMEFLENKHKNKGIFSSNFQKRMSRTDDYIERCKRIGMGSTNYGGDLNKGFFDMLDENRVFFTGHSMSDPRENRAMFKKLSQVEQVSPELEKEVEEMCYETAKRYPWVNAWHFAGECEAGGQKKYKLLKNKNFKDFVKLFMACYRGVKRFDPTKMVKLSGGPCNMMPQGGTQWVDRYLTAVDGQVKFDGVAIHPYRSVPENPDLDDDTQVFLKMLSKHGYDDVPIYWNEGIYYTYYNIPQWGLNPHKGCSTDHYRAYCPTYHMGWGERISAAYFARSWLVALKYMDRVKQFNGWCSWMSMDAYLTPFAFQKVPNTLGHLLGNATFKEDVRFAPGVRSYVFEDDKGRPVAALWSHIAKVDRGFEPSPVGEFQFKGELPEIIDLMGNKIDIQQDGNGIVKLPVTPFPIFFRGRAGSLKTLCRVLTNAQLIGSAKSVIKVAGKPVNRTEMNIEFTNLVTKEFKGQADIQIKDNLKSVELDLKSKESKSILAPIPGQIPVSEVAAVNIPITIKEKNKTIKEDLSFRAFAVEKRKNKIAIDGNLDDWKSIPAIKMVNRNISKSAGSTTTKQISGVKIGYNGDHEATYQMTWDDDYLYLNVNVVDDVFRHKHGNPAGRWNNDSLQVYIDTFSNARTKTTKGFDGDDYNYDFYPNEKEGTLTAFRRYAPEQQIAGGLMAPRPNEIEKDIKTAFKRTASGYIYEIAMPKRILAPMKLKEGTVVGFAIYINDHDGKYVKSALTITPAGTGGFMKPHLYPSMILVK